MKTIGTLLIAAIATVCATSCGGLESVLLAPVTMTSALTFSPQTVNASPGQSIVWTNTDTISHTVTADVVGGPNSATSFPAGLSTGETFTWVVPANASGQSFYYHCNFHGTAGNGSSLGTGMAGVIVVN